jgi:hypothetical protein
MAGRPALFEKGNVVLAVRVPKGWKKALNGLVTADNSAQDLLRRAIKNFLKRNKAL